MTFESTPRPPGRRTPAAGRNTIAIVVVTPVEGRLSEDAKAAIRSVLAQSVVPETIFVANTGPQPLQDWSDQVLEETTLVEVRVPGAKNLGRAVSEILDEEPVAKAASWVWLVHDDMIAQPDVLEKMLELGRVSNSIGAIGPKQVKYEDPDKILEVGIAATRTARRVEVIEPDEIDQGQYDHLEDVLAVGTAGMLVRRSAWDKVGGLDPALGPFGDGLEFGRRLWRAGFRVVVAPGAIVRHHQRSFDHETAGRSSFGARRAAQMYNWVVAVPLWGLFPLLLWLPVWSLARAVGRLLTRQPRLAIAELGAYFGLVARSTNIYSQRRTISSVATVPRSTLGALEQTPKTLSEVRRHQKKIKSRGTSKTKALDPVALERYSRHRYTSAGAVLILVVLVAVLSVFIWSPYSEGIRGGQWGVLPHSWTTLAAQAWSGWQLSGDGAQGPASPVLIAMSLLSAPFALIGMAPSTFQIVLLYCSAPLAVLGAWLLTGLFTRSVPVRSGLALLWVALGTIWLPLSSGDMGLVLAYLALPLLFVGLWRGFRSPFQLRAESVSDIVITARPDRFAWLGLAGLALVAVAPSSPIMIKFAIVGAVLLAWLPSSKLLGELEGEKEGERDGSRLSGSRPAGRRSLEGLGGKLAGIATVFLPSLILMVPAIGVRAVRLAQRGSHAEHYGAADVWSWALGTGVAGPTPTWWQFLAGYSSDPSLYGPRSHEGWAAYWPTLVLVAGWGLLLWAVLCVLHAGLRTLPPMSYARRSAIRTGALFLSAVVLWAFALSRDLLGTGEGSQTQGYPGILMAAGSLSLIGAIAASMEQVRILGKTLRQDPGNRRSIRIRGFAGALGGILGITSLIALSLLGSVGPLSQGVRSSSAEAGAPGGNTSWEPHTVSPVPTGGFPLTAQEAQSGPRAARVLSVRAEDDVINAQLLRGPGMQMADVLGGAPPTDATNLGAVEQAEEEQAIAIAALVTGIQDNAATLLADHAIDVVLLEAGTENYEDYANQFDATEGLERIGSVDIGTMWRVRPENLLPARVTVQDGAGQVVDVASGPVFTTQDIEVPTDSVLALAETADPHWIATFDGKVLTPVTNEDHWQQRWEIPAGNGPLTIRYQQAYLPWWQWTSGIALVLLVSSAIPWRYRPPTRVRVEGGSK